MKDIMESQEKTHVIKNRVRERFADWSRVYDRHILQDIIFKTSHDQILKHIEADHQEPHILDIGCGTGEFAMKILKHSENAYVHCIDISKEMVGLAASKFDTDDRVSLKVGDVEHLPYEDNSFDYVTCSHSFHHYPNQGCAMEEMFRVLKPDGTVIIVDGCKDGFLGKVIYDFFVTKKEGDVYHMHSSEYDALLKEKGFADIKQVVFNGLAPVLCTVGTAKKDDNSL